MAKGVIPMDWCVVYNAFNDALSMDLAEVFLELWLKMEGKHVAIPGYGLVILETGVSIQVVARMNVLHLIRQITGCGQ